VTEAIAMKQFRKAKRDDSVNRNYGNSGQPFHCTLQRNFAGLAHLNFGNRYGGDRDIIEPSAFKHLFYREISKEKFNDHVSIAHERIYRHAIFLISFREIFLPFNKPKSSRNSFSDLKVPLGISFKKGLRLAAFDFFLLLSALTTDFIKIFFQKYRHSMNLLFATQAEKKLKHS
jgi:hypothetical protein